MANAQQMLAECARWIGIKESPAGSNCQPFSKPLGRQCESWCADFLVLCARHVGLPLPSESASTPTMGTAFKQAGRWHTTPEVGDFAFWHFPNEPLGIDHVSVVESFTALQVSSIDGNSSVSGSQSNGGEVVRRTRSRSLVVGYGRPLYAASPSAGGLAVVHNWVASLRAPNGGVWHVQADGGIVTDKINDGPEAPFYGSIPGVGGLPASFRVLTIVPDRGSHGYCVLALDTGDSTVHPYEFQAS